MVIKIKKLSKLFFVLAAVLLFGGSNNPVYAEEYFVINEYYVNIEVFDNNTVMVEEILNVDFTTERHGIYREIPTRGYMTRVVDGEEIKTRYRAKVFNISVEDYKYETYNEGSYKVIKIGDKNKYVNGKQEYKITYLMDFGDDGVEDFDEFYFNLIGTDWDTYIYNAYMTVKMPDDFDHSKIGLSSGYEGMEGSDILDYRVHENTVSVKTNTQLHPHEGVTIRIELPEGYFANETVPYDWTWVLYVGIALLLSAVVLLWVLLGRDEKIYPSVEFYPPENLTPAEIGYIVDATIDSKDLISLIIYWADQGYIRIEERGRRDFYLVKLKPLSVDANYYEHTMFSDLFKKRVKFSLSDVVGFLKANSSVEQFEAELKSRIDNEEIMSFVRVRDLENVFYTTMDKVRKMIREKFKKDDGNKIYTVGSIIAKVVAFLLCPLPIFFGGLVIKAPVASDLESMIVGLVVTNSMILFAFITIDILVRKWHSTKKIMKTINVILSVLVLTGLYAIAWAIILPSSKEVPISFLCIASSLIMGICGLFMHKRTPEMNKMQEKILGLRMFLDNAEKDRINELVEENPEYFYNILPYAYVLGVTDKWAKQFEHIAMTPPTWYASSIPIAHFSASSFESSLTRGFNSMTSSMSSSPSSSSGGGSVGGGGGGGGGGSW